MKRSERIVEWIKGLKESQGMKKAIIGISGGKDSAVCAMLCVKALGKENVIGVLMPNGRQSDIADSYKVCDTLGIRTIKTDISGIYDNVLEEAMDAGVTLSENSKANVAPRIRSMMLYAIGQTLGARVCGTTNHSEWVLGYFTKWGDNACDFAPLKNILCSEVIEIGLELAEEFGIPKELIQKPPSDGIWGQTDEERLGVSYQDVDKDFPFGHINLPKEKRKIIEDRFVSTIHKREEVPSFE